MFSLKQLIITMTLYVAITPTIYADDIANQSEELYRHMVYRGSPYPNLHGRYPVSAEAIGYGEHFKIIRDSKGRVKRLERWLGKKITRGGYARFGAVSNAAMIELEYTDNKITRRYLDENGNLMINYWGVAIDEFTLDENGNKKSLIYKDLKGNRISDTRDVWITNWQVSKDGKTVIEDRFGKDGKQKRFNDFMDFGRVKMIFDDKGLRLETQNIDQEGNPINSPQRQVAISRVIYDDKNLDEKILSWYDADGKLKNLGSFDNLPGVDGFSSEVYEHDMNGYTTGMVNFDVNGNIIALPSNGSVFVRNTFNMFGIPTDVRNFNAKGFPTEDANGIARLEIISNEKGQTLSVRRYNLQGELVNGKNDGFAIIKVTYPTNSSHIIEYLDKAGNKVTQEQS